MHRCSYMLHSGEAVLNEELNHQSLTAPDICSSNILVVHAKCAHAPVIYSSFHSHMCTDFHWHAQLSPHSHCMACAAWFWHHSMSSPHVRSTWFTRRLRNLHYSTRHQRPACEFSLRAHETCTLHTCNQVCRHAHTHTNRESL